MYNGIMTCMTSMCDMDVDHSTQTLAMCIVGAGPVHLVLPESQGRRKGGVSGKDREPAVGTQWAQHSSCLPSISGIFNILKARETGYQNIS